jgi:hypothetical protein
LSTSGYQTDTGKFLEVGRYFFLHVLIFATL